LQSNMHELAAQLYLQRRDWSRVQLELNQAATLMKDSRSKYTGYIAKWQAIAESLKNGRVEPELLKIREEAVSSGNPELWRDCDYYIGMVGCQMDQLTFLYFGTPFLSFRRKIQHEAGSDFKLPTHYIRHEGSAPPAQVFDLSTGQMEKTKTHLVPGQLLH